MKRILFHLPHTSLQRCFHPLELRRLTEMFSLSLPEEGEEPAALFKRFQEHAVDADAVVTGWGTPPLTSDMLDGAPRVKAICHSAGTIRRLVPSDIWERSIRVCSANDALAVGVAETTLGMIIAGLKNFFGARDWTREGGWSALTFGDDKPSVTETFRKTIGIVSASSVGRQLIRLLASFDVTVLVYDPYLSDAQAAALGVETVSLQELAERSDVFTIHAPSLPETKGLVSREILSLLPDGAIVINTARGDIIDQDALVLELTAGRLRAFLDVTWPEPPEKNHPLRFLPNVVLTPHLAGAVTNGCFRQGALVVDQLLDLAAGRETRGEITAQRFAVMA
jgi:phosphoglycerate dehydrogenase-like enzyme